MLLTTRLDVGSELGPQFLEARIYHGRLKEFGMVVVIETKKSCSHRWDFLRNPIRRADLRETAGLLGVSPEILEKAILASNQPS